MSRVFKPKSENQSNYVRMIVENDLTFCIGPAGSGKTSVCVGIAMGHLLNNKCDQIIITRPTIGTDEEYSKGIGFLPGSLRDKMDPYLRPIYDEMLTYIDKHSLEQALYDETIEIAPLDFMRGRTFHNAFVIMDEAQNCSYQQIKMFVTRLGKSSRMVINGDIDQFDRKGHCALDEWFNDIIPEINGIGRIELDKGDIVRHSLVSAILTATEEYERSLK
jgi:phosphate starvation-inducible PhoH-like protein